MRQAGRLTSAVTLLLLWCAALVLGGPSAAAATPTGAAGAHPAALASTGLNITEPVIIGIVLLILGIAALAWAFLRKGSAEQHR